MRKLDSIDIKNFQSNTGFVFDNINLSYQLYGQEIGDSPIILAVSYTHLRAHET